MGKKSSRAKAAKAKDEEMDIEEDEEISEDDEEVQDELDESTIDDEEDLFEERSEVARQFEEAPSDEITEERVYTVPLGKAYLRPRKKRAKRAITMIKEFFKRHMKAEEIIMLPEVNQYVWERGIEKPPRRIRIRATKSLEGVVTLYLYM